MTLPSSENSTNCYFSVALINPCICKNTIINRMSARLTQHYSLFNPAARTSWECDSLWITLSCVHSFSRSFCKADWVTIDIPYQTVSASLVSTPYKRAEKPIGLWELLLEGRVNISSRPSANEKQHFTRVHLLMHWHSMHLKGWVHSVGEGQDGEHTPGTATLRAVTIHFLHAVVSMYIVISKSKLEPQGRSPESERTAARNKVWWAVWFGVIRLQQVKHFNQKTPLWFVNYEDYSSQSTPDVTELWLQQVVIVVIALF